MVVMLMGKSSSFYRTLRARDHNIKYKEDNSRKVLIKGRITIAKEGKQINIPPLA
jgi:hypothetical protein